MCHCNQFKRWQVTRTFERSTCCVIQVKLSVTVTVVIYKVDVQYERLVKYVFVSLIATYSMYSMIVMCYNATVYVNAITGM